MIVLSTERLVLRWFTPDDAAFLLELVTDPAWLEHIGDRGLRTVDEAKAWVDSRLVASYLEHGHGLWAIERRSDGALVGMCGLVCRATLPEIDVGYALVPRGRGHGYVREAAAACLAYGHGVLGRRQILAITSPQNLPSISVLESIGMRHLRTEVLEGESRQSAVFSWSAPGAAPSSRGDDDRSAIDALATRFFSAFDNRGGAVAPVAALPALFLRDALITTASARETVTTGVGDFIVPRATLLSGGRLREFSESEVEARTEIFASIAQRWCRYEKRGVLDNAPFQGSGVKTMQLVKTALGWRIAALAWQDDPRATLLP